MGSRNLPPLRALPRVFLPTIDLESEEFGLPESEVKKLHHVLRLGNGDQIAVLPNDGTVIRCELRRNSAVPIEQPVTAPRARRKLNLGLGMPRMEAIEQVVRQGTEMGVDSFTLFEAARSVVHWDPDKLAKKLLRLENIAREAAEVCYRGTLPKIHTVASLAEIMKRENCWVCSEQESATITASQAFGGEEPLTIVIGPEGGWAPQELPLIADRSVTLGSLVFRVDTAAAAAIALALL